MRERVKRNSRVTRSAENVQHRSPSGRKRKSDVVEDTDSAKKSNIPVQDIISKIQKTVVGDKQFDAFCWICHKVAEEFYCEDCPRVYHKACLKKIRNILKDSACECKLTTVDGAEASPTEPSKLKELIKDAFTIVLEGKKPKKNQVENAYFSYFKTWPELPENVLLCQKKDIAMIADKITHNPYETTGEFFQDVKWLYHNSYITKGSDHEMTILAKKLEIEIKQHLTDIEACGKCYIGKSSRHADIDVFTKVCDEPHPIVWAKLKGFRFWPAKCLRIINGHADVRFFGTHDRSLLASQVYKLSRQNPSGNPKKNPNSKRMTSFDEALAELSMYISNYEKKFGSFQYYKVKTPLEHMKRSGKRSLQSKNRTQLNNSMDTENIENDGEISHNISGYSETSTNQDSPQLNVSILNDDPAETKVSVFHPSSVSLENISAKDNADLIQNPKEPMPSVVFMSFSAEDGQNEISISDEIIEENSKSNSLKSEIQHRLPKIKGCSVVCNDISDQVLPNNAEITQKNSASDSNINACNSPSTSSPTPFVITSTHSLTNHDTFSDPVVGSKSNVNEMGSSSDEKVDKLLDSINTQVLPQLLPEEDEEIEFIREKQPHSSIVTGLARSKSMTKTMCELLLCNKPNVKTYMQRFQNIALNCYLAMWLDTHKRNIDANELKTMNQYHISLCERLHKYKILVGKLKKQISELKNKVAEQLNDEERKVALRNDIILAQNARSVEMTNALRQENKELTERLQDKDRKFKNLENLNILEASQKVKIQVLLQQSNKELSEYKKKIEDLENKLQQSNKELAEYKKRAEDLENKLTSMKKPVQNVECQTYAFETMAEKLEEVYKNKTDSCFDNSIQLINNNMQSNANYQQDIIQTVQSLEVREISSFGSVMPQTQMVPVFIAGQQSQIFPKVSLPHHSSVVLDDTTSSNEMNLFSLKTASHSKNVVTHASNKSSNYLTKYSSSRSISKSRSVKEVKKTSSKSSSKKRK